MLKATYLIRVDFGWSPIHLIAVLEGWRWRVADGHGRWGMGTEGEKLLSNVWQQFCFVKLIS